MEGCTKDNTKMIRKMDMASTVGRIIGSIKATGYWASSMVWVFIVSHQRIEYSLGCGNKVKELLSGLILISNTKLIILKSTIHHFLKIKTA